MFDITIQSPLQYADSQETLPCGSFTKRASYIGIMISSTLPHQVKRDGLQVLMRELQVNQFDNRSSQRTSSTSRNRKCIESEVFTPWSLTHVWCLQSLATVRNQMGRVYMQNQSGQASRLLDEVFLNFPSLDSYFSLGLNNVSTWFNRALTGIPKK